MFQRELLLENRNIGEKKKGERKWKMGENSPTRSLYTRK